MIGIYGAGAFGTALAIAFSSKGQKVLLCGRDDSAMRAMDTSRENARYLPDVEIPSSVEVTADVSAISKVETLLFAIPAQKLRDGLDRVKPQNMLVLCAKGIDQQSGQRQSEIAAGYLPEDQIAVLSGPSFAQEIAKGHPTALTIACRNREHLSQLQETLSTKTIRPYANQDVVGVELGGALKNVYALACGMVAGAELGESARASLMTRSFSEMANFAQLYGAEKSTLFGLSGFGDLVLSASSMKSRNFAHGFEIARRGSFEPSNTVEGIATTHALARLGREKGVDLPICFALAAFLKGALTMSEIQEAMLSRPLRDEQS